MNKVYYNDDTGMECDVVSEHATPEAAHAEKVRLGEILDRLLMRGKTFETARDTVDERIEAARIFYRSQPEWKLLCEAMPAIFTENADPFMLGFNMHPTIETGD